MRQGESREPDHRRLLRQALRPWLIEVNESPNLSAHGSELKERLLVEMTESLVQLLIDQQEVRPDREHRAAGEAVGAWTNLLVSADASEPGLEPAVPKSGGSAAALEVVGRKCVLPHRRVRSTNGVRCEKQGSDEVLATTQVR